jgi:hypothetical protein
LAFGIRQKDPSRRFINSDPTRRNKTNASKLVKIINLFTIQVETIEHARPTICNPNQARLTGCDSKRTKQGEIFLALTKKPIQNPGSSILDFKILRPIQAAKIADSRFIGGGRPNKINGFVLPEKWPCRRTDTAI